MINLIPKNELHKEFLDIVEALVNKKIKEEPISLILLGGSVARGDMEKHSDIDIVYYVPKKELEKFSRGFWKFQGKFIEDSYYAVEDLNIEELIDEVVSVYDPNNILKNLKRKEGNLDMLSKDFKNNLLEAKKIQKLAKKYFEKGDYKKTLVYLFSMQSYTSILVHSLPPRFSLPFPTFKLYSSIKEISEKLETPEIYSLSTKLFDSSDDFVEYFEEGYRIMYKIQKKMNPEKENYGFYDPLKIDYNVEYMRDIIKKYPQAFASRFALGCLVDWAWGDKTNSAEMKFFEPFRKKLDELMLKSLDIKEITKEFTQEKLEITQKLEKVIDRLIERGLL